MNRNSIRNHFVRLTLGSTLFRIVVGFILCLPFVLAVSLAGHVLKASLSDIVVSVVNEKEK